MDCWMMQDAAVMFGPCLQSSDGRFRGHRYLACVGGNVHLFAPLHCCQAALIRKELEQAMRAGRLKHHSTYTTHIFVTLSLCVCIYIYTYISHTHIYHVYIYIHYMYVNKHTHRHTVFTSSIYVF